MPGKRLNRKLECVFGVILYGWCGLPVPDVLSLPVSGSEVSEPTR